MKCNKASICICIRVCETHALFKFVRASSVMANDGASRLRVNQSSDAPHLVADETAVAIGRTAGVGRNGRVVNQ